MKTTKTTNPIENTNLNTNTDERLPEQAAPVRSNLLPTPRLLHEDEIECRVGTITDKGLSLLLYKTARTDIMLLDETYGSGNWQRTHRVENGAVICTLSIRDPYDPSKWIVREDVGTESPTEPIKSAFSDSLKRTAVSLQIGIELYSAPWIWIPTEKRVKGELVKMYNPGTKNGKPITYDKFEVEAIRYDENRRICALSIKNTNLGCRVYTWYNDRAQLREE